MSISDLIVVMDAGVVQQIGGPQAVYDDPANLFVAKFLGTPPISVFSGRVEGGRLFIGEEAVLETGIMESGPVTVGIRPEAFIPAEDGPFSCDLKSIEVMGRDVSVVSEHPASLGGAFRAIVSADAPVSVTPGKIRFRLKPEKVFLFHPETGVRLRPAGDA